jgi:branched-chain amino acid transport system permease protein
VIAIPWRRPSRNPRMVVRYADDLRLFPSALAKVGLVALVALWLLLPYGLSNYQLSVLAYAGISAIGATGLNLLVGYTGQVSLGHGFFIAVGSYSVAYFGAELGWPMVVWLPVTALVGGVIGAVIGPFALRLRGNYLVIASLGMLFVGQYVFANWESFTGGGVGRSTNGAIPRLDANSFQLLGAEHTREHGYFWLVWALVGLVALVAKNVVRGRPGRAMQAVRDRDLAAEVIGVSLGRYKVGAFVWSGAIGAVGGAMYACLLRTAQWVDPDLAMLNASIQYAAVIIIGGLGTIYGPVLGALLIGSLPQVIQSITLERDLPLVSGDRGGQAGLIDVLSLNNLIYGLLIVLFLLFEPHGLAGVWRRVKSWFTSWPFAS